MPLYPSFASPAAVALKADLASPTFTGVSAWIVHRNSSNAVLRTFGNFGFLEQSGSQRGVQVSTGPFVVATGDYLTLEAREESDTSVTIEGDGATVGQETYLTIKVNP